MNEVPRPLVAVFSSSRDGWLKYLLRSIIEQSFAGQTVVKILTHENWYTNLVLRNLGVFPDSIDIEVIGGCSINNFEERAVRLFLNSEADVFIPTFPNEYWISSSKIDQHVSAHQQGIRGSWHPVVSRNHLESSLSNEQWEILDLPSPCGTALSRTAFESQSQSIQEVLVSLGGLSTKGSQVQRLEFPMVQINRSRQGALVMERLRRVWDAYRHV
jgi:hypothetical protein